MAIKLFDSELRVMELIWQKGAIRASKIAEILGDEIGWSKTTTYTVIKKCLDKGAIKRENPHFVCTALIDKSKVQLAETTEHIDKFYNGSASMLFASLVQNKKLTKNEINELKDLVSKLEE